MGNTYGNTYFIRMKTASRIPFLNLKIKDYQ